jgi:hypothetical protein
MAVLFFAIKVFRDHTAKNFNRRSGWGCVCDDQKH